MTVVTSRANPPGRPSPGPDGLPADDPGLLAPAETSLLIDQYELAMAASYLKRGMNQPAVFELFVRDVPSWLLLAGLGPKLRLVTEVRSRATELA